MSVVWDSSFEGTEESVKDSVSSDLPVGVCFGTSAIASAAAAAAAAADAADDDEEASADADRVAFAPVCRIVLHRGHLSRNIPHLQESQIAQCVNSFPWPQSLHLTHM